MGKVGKEDPVVGCGREAWDADTHLRWTWQETPPGVRCKHPLHLARESFCGRFCISDAGSLMRVVLS